MKLLPAAVTIACSALLISCGHKSADNPDADLQAQQRLADQQQSELREREAALDERERLLTEREQQLAAAAPPAAAPAVAPAPVEAVQSVPAPVAGAAPPVSADASYQEFYDALSPYGAWVLMPGYGYVWQPSATVQNFRWRPYTLGRWAFTDDGWTWMSDEPFGWITYHYGRWMRTRTLNWVWTPGDQWAPAWVSWRYGSDFVGWAPLPPQARFDGATGIQQWADQQYSLGASDYTFVPASEFGDDSMAGVEVPPDQNGPIYDDSNNVTNLYYGADATGVYGIICYGPSYEFLRSKSHRPLGPKLRLTRAGFRANGNNGAVVTGNMLQMTAPRIVPGRTPAAPKAVRGRVADVRVIAPAGTPPPHGSLIPPLYQPPRTAGSVTAPAPAAGTVERPVDAVQPSNGPRAPSQAADAITGREASQGPPAPDQTEAQRAHDVAVIQEEQAAEEERRRKETAVADEARQADDQRAALEAAHAAAAHAAAVHAAAEEQAAKVTREEAARQAAVPASVPAGTQAAGQPRGPQQ